MRTTLSPSRVQFACQCGLYSLALRQDRGCTAAFIWQLLSCCQDSGGFAWRCAPITCIQAAFLGACLRSLPIFCSEQAATSACHQKDSLCFTLPYWAVDLPCLLSILLPQESSQPYLYCRHICPYHASRDLLNEGASLIFLTYSQLFDPPVRSANGLDALLSGAVVVIDEARAGPHAAV